MCNDDLFLAFGENCSPALSGGIGGRSGVCDDNDADDSDDDDDDVNV